MGSDPEKSFECDIKKQEVLKFDRFLLWKMYKPAKRCCCGCCTLQCAMGTFSLSSIIICVIWIIQNLINDQYNPAAIGLSLLYFYYCGIMGAYKYDKNKAQIYYYLNAITICVIILFQLSIAQKIITSLFYDGYPTIFIEKLFKSEKDMEDIQVLFETGILYINLIILAIIFIIFDFCLLYFLWVLHCGYQWLKVGQISVFKKGIKIKSK